MKKRTPECVILIGIPAAGKTTFYRHYFASTHKHVSNDLRPAARGRGEQQRREIAAALSGGAPVVIDNTNPTAAVRKDVIDLARRHGARVVGYFLNVPTRVAVARNAARSGSAQVPKVAIFTAAKRLQPPTLAEGFDQLFEVTPGEGERFVVMERTI